MDTKKLCNTLFLGILMSWSFFLLITFILSLTDHHLRSAVWSCLFIEVVILFYMRSVNKINDNDILAGVERLLLTANLVAVGSGVFIGAITLGENGMPHNLRLISLAFGLPSLVVVIYRQLILKNS